MRALLSRVKCFCKRHFFLLTAIDNTCHSAKAITMSSKNKNRAASVRAGKGKCRLCQQQFAKSKIEKHLTKCLESKFPPQADEVIIIIGYI